MSGGTCYPQFSDISDDELLDASQRAEIQEVMNDDQNLLEASQLIEAYEVLESGITDFQDINTGTVTTVLETPPAPKKISNTYCIMLVLCLIQYNCSHIIVILTV